MNKKLLGLLIGLVALGFLVACGPATQTAPEKQTFDSSIFATYPGAWKSVDAASTIGITKEDALKAIKDACIAGMGSIPVNDIATDCRLATIVKVSMNNGTKSCTPYNVANDAAVALDSMDLTKVYSYAVGFFPIPEDAEKISTVACK